MFVLLVLVCRAVARLGVQSLAVVERDLSLKTKRHEVVDEHGGERAVRVVHLVAELLDRAQVRDVALWRFGLGHVGVPFFYLHGTPPPSGWTSISPSAWRDGRHEGYDYIHHLQHPS